MLTARCGYLPGSNNLGVVRTGDGGAIAIDTGIDKDAARRLRKALDAAKLTLRAIINTHHHADHIGGNAFLVRNIAGVAVYAPVFEAALIGETRIEPLYLNMGAAPPAPLTSKFVLAKAAAVDHTFDGATLEVAGVTLEVVALPGHTLGQVGLALDGVCYAADAFFGAQIVAKHVLPYAQHAGQQLQSLATLAARDEAWYVPGHGEVLARADLATTLEVNRAAIERVTQVVFDLLTEPADLHTLGRRVRAALGIEIGAVAQYAVFLSGVAGHLARLAHEGRAELVLNDGLVWRRVDA